MSGSLEVLGQPRRHEVWLTVATESLSPEQHALVSEDLRSLPGWSAGMFGINRVSTTYEANATSSEAALRAAVAVMLRVGVRVLQLEAHTTWRVQFGLTRPMLDDSDPQFLHVTATGASLGRRIRREESVFEASFDQPGFGAITVDFKGELPPDAELLAGILSLIREAETS